MCGITGFIDLNKKSSKEILKNMTDVLYHRGPDDAGYFFEETPDYQIGLGHRRLAILDLSPKGHQPMGLTKDCKIIYKDDELDKAEYIIVYNGEVYNFKKIREELEEYGYKFESSSDTEVILKSYHKWGTEAVHKFNGMFAIAIYDKYNQKLILIRDRAGVKPLYYYYKDGLFMFASELKAFHKHPKFIKELCLEGLSLYLQYGYITAPYTIFKYTYKLLPGYFLILKKDGEVKIEKYWDITDYFLKGIEEKERWLKKREEEVVEELEEILTESFKLRLVADVPVGIFLSGGIDSTLVTVLLQKELTKPLKTFTIGFYEKEYNEAPYAKRIAKYLGTDHTELYCTSKEAVEIIPKLPEIYDEPFADSSAIPTLLVSKLAKTKVKVSLSADGGDEQFGGYKKYFKDAFNYLKFLKLSKYFYVKEIISHVPVSLLSFIFSLIKKKNFHSIDYALKLKFLIQNLTPLNFADILSTFFLETQLKELGITNILSHVSELEKRLNFKEKFNVFELLMIYDLLTYLPDDILTKVDRATMSVALEGREPFLDVRILEYSSMLPVKFKIEKGKGKKVLRKLLSKYLPPDIYEREKKGFSIPIYQWLRKDLREFYLTYLNESRIRKGGIFNFKKVNEILQKFLNNSGYKEEKVFMLLIFEMWKEKWIG